MNDYEKEYEHTFRYDCKNSLYFGEGYDKEYLLKYLVKHTLSKTNRMFDWNIPQYDIQQRDMELRIQSTGYTVIAPYEGKIYSLRGTLGGRPNFNYMPSWAVVANPYLNLFETFKVYYGYDYGNNYIDLKDLKECVIIPNDTNYMGLVPTLEYYLSSLIETNISRRVATINARAFNAIIAKDGDTVKSIEEFYKELRKGKLKSILAENILGEDNVTSVPFSGGSSSQRAITELIENEQYDKASLLNELGLQANYNMKREAINSNESQLAQDAILPFADDMLEQRKKACERINGLFNTKWSVDFSSAWKYKRDEIEMSIENMKEPANQLATKKDEENDNDNN